MNCVQCFEDGTTAAVECEKCSASICTECYSIYLDETGLDSEPPGHRPNHAMVCQLCEEKHHAA